MSIKNILCKEKNKSIYYIVTTHNEPKASPVSKPGWCNPVNPSNCVVCVLQFVVTVSQLPFSHLKQ